MKELNQFAPKKVNVSSKTSGGEINPEKNSVNMNP
jgi:hypothetical protein